jgi:hypothetical protein
VRKILLRRHRGSIAAFTHRASQQRAKITGCQCEYVRSTLTRDWVCYGLSPLERSAVQSPTAHAPTKQVAGGGQSRLFSSQGRRQKKAAFFFTVAPGHRCTGLPRRKITPTEYFSPSQPTSPTFANSSDYLPTSCSCDPIGISTVVPGLTILVDATVR